MKELTVEANKENLLQVQSFIDEELEAADCPMATQIAIDVAVEELFVNIASYAYAPDTGTATVRMACTEDHSAVTLTFIDSGIPFNPLEREDPDLSLPVEEREIGGLGILMVKKTMDEAHYERVDGQNILTLTKRI